MRSIRFVLVLLASALLAAPASASPLDPVAQDLLGAPATITFGAGTRVHQPRMHEGARVVDQGVARFIDGSGQELRTLGRVEGVQTVGTFEVDAGAIARSLHPDASITEIEPVWHPAGEKHRPEYIVRLLDGALPRILRIAADSGEVRADLVALSHYEAPVQVYEVNEDAGPLVERTVVDLEYENWLFAPGLEVVDDTRMEASGRVYDADGTFLYEPDDWRFSAAMGFYHHQRGEEFLIEASGGSFEGFADPAVARVNLTTQNSLGIPGYAINAAHALYQGTHLYFVGGGEYEQLVLPNFAHDSEVWLHEMGHGLSSEAAAFDTALARSGNPQFGALLEGVADYGAAAYTGDPSIGDAVWDLFPELRRDLTVRATFPDDFEAGADPHVNGLIPGSAAWALRDRLDTDVADAVVLTSQYYLTEGNYDFTAWADGLVMADEDLFEGRHVAAIIDTLSDHGLGPHIDGERPQVVPVFMDPGAPVGNTVRVQSVGDATSWVWRIVDAPEDSAVQELEVTGEEIAFTADVAGTWTIEVVGASEGWRLSEPQTIDIEVGMGGEGCSVGGAGGLLLLPLFWIGRRRS